jgi:hypothetical protein
MREDVVRMHVAQAYSRAVSFETKRHLRAALAELDPELPTALEKCPVCGRVGLAERIEVHDCGGGR